MNAEHSSVSHSPKHILSLDGGGVRGVLTLAFLERIEQFLAQHYGAGDQFRLCDHFNLIGGTSTGAIIATGLSLGYTVSEMIDIYKSLAKRAFANPRKILGGGGLIMPKFQTRQLESCIEEHVQDLTLGSPELRCGLAIVAKRLDTDSIWIFHNHPEGPQVSTENNGFGHTAKKDLLLRNLIRASTAAPTYFEPEFIDVSPGVEGTFVDGGISLHNNPSLALFMLATSKEYPFRWSVGEDELHILSIGTGKESAEVRGKISRDTPTYRHAYYSIRSLMAECDSMIHTSMHSLGQCVTPNYVEGEFGELKKHNEETENFFQYARLNVEFRSDWFKTHLNMEVDVEALQHLSRIDEPSAIDDLLEIGHRAAEKQVDLDHLVLK